MRPPVLTQASHIFQLRSAFEKNGKEARAQAHAFIHKLLRRHAVLRAMKSQKPACRSRSDQTRALMQKQLQNALV